uniref:HMA domain-containing protein n=1 Tax=Noccaea caerulescens TaxID=107243 RepID=A0A1J3GK45_NOCCA
MQKAVLKLDACCEKTKQKAMATVCRLSGVNSVDVKEGNLTVTGEIDVFMIVKKLKKICYTEIITVGPAKEPEKKPESKPEQKPEVICHFNPPCPPYSHFNGCVYENPNACVIS